MINNINISIKSAMLNKQTIRLSVLRSLKTALETALSAKGRCRKPLAPDEENRLVQKQIAQRVESIVQWEKGGRLESADAEKKEIEILKEFLPDMMSDDDVKDLVERVLAESDAVIKKDMGKAISRAKELAAGRVDLKTLSQLIAARLI